jgi:hypothetical protein
MEKELFEMTVTAEDNAIGVIPGFPWKLQEEAIKTTTLFIVGDSGTSQQYFDKFRCMQMARDPIQGLKYGECVAISYDYFTQSIEQLVHIPYTIDGKVINIKKDQLDELKLKIKNYIVDLFLKIDKEVEEERKGKCIKKYISHEQPKEQPEWTVVGKKKQKNKNKNKNKNKKNVLTPEEKEIQKKAYKNHANCVLSRLCMELECVIQKRRTEYLSNKQSMNTFLLGVNDKYHHEKTINIINSKHGFYNVRRKIGQYVGISY